MVSAAATANEDWAISIGDPVDTADGHRLGEVTRADAYEVLVESGLIFRRRYVLDLAECDGYRDGVLITSLTLEEAQARERR
ncbi:MAG TPA: hypothetical protein VD789_02930 [Thermomicrobiales bacterium]|nr:hypothetical protein [Thermomicrobiales bacterium]